MRDKIRFALFLVLTAIIISYVVIGMSVFTTVLMSTNTVLGVIGLALDGITFATVAWMVINL